jgi:predicted dehydrogenase
MKHRILVIGVGSIGERHARCLLATGRAQVAICETNGDLRRTIAERYPVVGAFADLDHALAERWDAAVIATPAPLHIPQARRLAEAGAALLIEKPLSTGLDGIDGLEKLVLDRGLVAAVGYVLRANPSLAAMREAIAAGRFGRPLQLVTTAGQHFPSFRPAYRQVYYRDRTLGGGAIQDAMTHYLDAGLWLAGPIQRLVVDAAHQALPGVEVEDTVHVLARHGDAMASYCLNQYQAPNEVTMTVVCEEGTARWELHEQRWRWKSLADGPAGPQPWHDEPHPLADRDEWFTRQEQAFLDACEGKGPPLCRLDEAVHNLRANLAALASAETGQWQDVEGRRQVSKSKS